MTFGDEGKRWRARAMSKPSGCESTDFTEYPSICWFALGIRRWRWGISHFLLRGSERTNVNLGSYCPEDYYLLDRHSPERNTAFPRPQCWRFGAFFVPNRHGFRHAWRDLLLS